jgi:hypothetical protein
MLLDTPGISSNLHKIPGYILHQSTPPDPTISQVSFQYYPSVYAYIYEFVSFIEIFELKFCIYTYIHTKTSLIRIEIWKMKTYCSQLGICFKRQMTLGRQMSHISFQKITFDSFFRPAFLRSKTSTTFVFYRWMNIRGGGLINLWLYKENIKLRDWKNIFTLHISPELHTLMTPLF